MRISEKNIIARNININDSYQSVEFMPMVETIGHTSMMTGVIMSLLMTCFSSTSVTAAVQQDSYNVPEEVILHHVRALPVERTIIKTRLSGLLDNMRTLEEGWGPGGLPIVPAAIDFSKRLIAYCSDAELEHWNVGPYVNGTVMMHYRGEGKRSSINIGKSTVSAFKKVGASYEAFQKPADECFAEVLGIIRSLNS